MKKVILPVAVLFIVSRRQFNDRRKAICNLCGQIRSRIAIHIDGGEDYFCIDSKPIEECRFARGKRYKMGQNDFATAPYFGYCALQVPISLGISYMHYVV